MAINLSPQGALHFSIPYYSRTYLESIHHTSNTAMVHTQLNCTVQYYCSQTLFTQTLESDTH